MYNIHDKFKLISKNILDAYNQENYKKLKELLDLEDREYKKMDVHLLNNYIDYLEYESKKLNIIDLENYEIALYNNQKQLIIRRMVNKVNQILNRYYYFEQNIERLEKDIIPITNNIIFVIQNFDGAMSELDEKILTNIETKYLYFILNNSKLDVSQKSRIFTNTLFVNPYLEEKILSPTIKIDEFIKNEDNLYFNLWDNIKNEYKLFIFDYCTNASIYTIESMLSEIDLDDNIHTIARSIYLRTLFNYLDEETIEKIHEQYNNLEINKLNTYGDDLIIDSFNKVESDNYMIQKIKTR